MTGSCLLFAQNQDSIIIYGSNSCNHCINLKSSLDSAEIVYKFYDVDINPAKENEMIDKLRSHQIRGNITLPVVDVNREELLIKATFESILNSLKKTD